MDIWVPLYFFGTKNIYHEMIPCGLNWMVWSCVLMGMFVCVLNKVEYCIITESPSSLLCLCLSDPSDVTVPCDHMIITVVWYILISDVIIISLLFFVSFSHYFPVFYLSVSVFYSCGPHKRWYPFSLSICKLSMCVFPGIANANNLSALICLHQQCGFFSQCARIKLHDLK